MINLYLYKILGDNANSPKYYKHQLIFVFYFFATALILQQPDLVALAALLLNRNLIVVEDPLIARCLHLNDDVLVRNDFEIGDDAIFQRVKVVGFGELYFVGIVLVVSATILNLFE